MDADTHILKHVVLLRTLRVHSDLLQELFRKIQPIAVMWSETYSTRFYRLFNNYIIANKKAFTLGCISPGHGNGSLKTFSPVLRLTFIDAGPVEGFSFG